jgi:methylated-DNA-protein-cysteine methyltransferase-like protein
LAIGYGATFPVLDKEYCFRFRNFISSMKTVSPLYEQIYAAVKKIPHGQVATYGQIAKMAGLSGQARLVGYALHFLPEGVDVPWHRVINARGEISRLPDPDGHIVQRQMLEAEGIPFSPAGRIDLQRYQFIPKD